MTALPDLRLVRLLHLASPLLPVGAYSYSQGLEAAVEGGYIRDAAAAQEWVGDALDLAMGRLEAPVLLRLHRAFSGRDPAAVRHWNTFFLATRETAELRAETVQMGYSLARLASALAFGAALEGLDEPAFPTAYACAAVCWDLEPETALVAYLWSWLENQILAAMKLVPLGQTEGQRVLLALGARVPACAHAAARLEDDELCNFLPGFALQSARHETQYSRLFRS